MTIIGVDIGQAQDYTAIAIVTPTVVGSGRQYHCVWIERLPLGTPYIEIVRRVDQHRQHVGKALIVFDETGVGRPVVEQAKRELRGARIVGLTITGGHSVNGWNVPKRALITNLQLLLQTRALKIAAGLPFVETLVTELRDYRVVIGANAHETYSPWREAEHDDLVLALAIAAWGATKLQPPKSSYTGSEGSHVRSPIN